MLKGRAIRGSGSATVSPSGAVTSPTAVTVTFPNGVAGIPVQIRASGSVSGLVILQYGAGPQIQLPVNPNAPFTSVAIPKSAFPNAVTSVNLQYEASGAGSIFIFVDYA
ncbi:MAG: hypothetical protein QXU18_10965 [Thermoplasmatales archaeon]